MPCARRDTGRKLRHERAAGGDAIEQIAMFGRITPIDPGAEDCDRTSRIHGTTMRGTVDPTRETAYDRESTRCEHLSESLCEPRGSGRTRTCSDDRHTRS